MNIDELYPKLQRIARWLAASGLPKGINADDLTQVAAIAMWQGKAKSLRDAKAYMTEHIRAERLHGTAMTRGEKGKRSTTKKVRRHHMAVKLELMPSRGENIEAAAIVNDLLRKMKKGRAAVLSRIHILGCTEEETAHALGVSDRTVRNRLAEICGKKTA